MSYTSQYNLNIRLSNIESRLNALVPPPPGFLYNLNSVLSVGNSAGTFDIDMNNNDILNCGDLDVVTINGSAYPPAIEDLQATLTAGNIANLGFNLTNTDAVTTSTILTNVPLNASNVGCYFNDSNIPPGVDSNIVITAQSNQSVLTASVLDNATGLTGTISKICNSGAVLNTDTATDGTNTGTATHTTTTSFSTDEIKYQLTGDIDNFSKSEVNGTNATNTIQAFSIAGGYGQTLALDVGTGSANITHTTTLGSNKSLVITTAGSVLFSSANLDSTANNLSFSTSSAGGAGQPNLTLNNTGNSTSGVCLEVFKDRPSVANGDVLFQESIYGRDSALNKQEYTRVTHTIRDRTSLAEDGSIELSAVVNGAFQTFIQINGNENETNFLRPLDMTGNNIRTTTGSLAINTASSVTAGAVLTLATKDATPGSGLGLALTGDTLLSATAGGSSGQHLCLSIAGTVYKIALLNV